MWEPHIIKASSAGAKGRALAAIMLRLPKSKDLEYEGKWLSPKRRRRERD